MANELQCHKSLIRDVSIVELVHCTVCIFKRTGRRCDRRVRDAGTLRIEVSAIEIAIRSQSSSYWGDHRKLLLLSMGVSIVVTFFK